MTEHAQFGSPSSAEREIRCPGSTAFPENQTQDSGSSVYADEGTAAHELAASCLRSKLPAHTFIGTGIEVNGKLWEVTEEFAADVQTYVDDVQRRAMGGQLLVEQRVEIEATGAFGTSDAIIIVAPDNDIDAEVEDLKFGRGEKVYAWGYATEDSPFVVEKYQADEDGEQLDKVEPNYQLMLYALGSLPIILMLRDTVHRIRLVINQPRLGSISELAVTPELLERFALYAADAKKDAEYARSLPDTVEGRGKFLGYLRPGEKQCRWCRAVSCPARDAMVAKEVGAEFEVIEAQGGIAANIPQSGLSRAFHILPFIKDWIRAVETNANALIASGGEITGIDGKPMKFVEGKLGNRAWSNEKLAEDALLGVLTEADVYQPKKIITASVAAKKLDKKKTAATWNDIFVPLITRAPGRPMLVLGSDPRPPFSGAAKSDEFEEVEGDDI